MNLSQEENISASNDPNLEWLNGIGVEFENNEVIFQQLSHKIQENLEKWRKDSPKSDVHAAIESLKPYFSVASVLYKWLQPPETSQHSLVQILSRDKKFQDPVFEMICNFLTLTAFNSTSKDNIRKIIDSIIKSLSFPPQIYHKDHIINLVFEAISNMSESLQPIIIRSLPSIIDPTPDSIKRLIDIMIEKPKFIQDALTALEGFPLSKEEIENVRKHVLSDVLSSASSNDLQSVIRFLVSTTDETNATKTVESFRKSLVILNSSRNQLALRKSGSLSIDDSNTFFVIQLKSALQFNQFFSRAYTFLLENKPAEIVILDYWVLYCMFGIPSQKLTAEKLIVKLCSDDTMNAQDAHDSISGHIGALEILVSSITDLISWCLGNGKSQKDDNENSGTDKLADIGTSLALTMFQEVENIATQQNIVGSLLMQIGIGTDENKRKAANVLASLDEKKLKAHLTLISGILPSYDSIPLSVFKIIISVIVKLEFTEGPEQSSQLHIFVSKMLASTKEAAKNAGVATASAILNRYAEFNDIEAIQIQFNSTMLAIGDDPVAQIHFFEELCNNKKRSDIFNKFLIENLTKQFSSIISPRTTNSESGISDWFCLDESLTNSIDFITGINESVEQKKTLSLQKYRKSVIGINSPIVFSHSGLKLLLDCHVCLNHDLEEVFGSYFRMSFKLFVAESNDFSSTQRVQALLSAHSYILETLNYFGPLGIDECYNRMLNRFEIEKHLIVNLTEFKVFNHPFFGEMFPKCNSIIKKANKTHDPSAFFVHYYRSFFNAPRLEYLDLLYKINLPINEDSLPIVIRLLDDYLYLIKPTRNQSTNQLFECKKVLKPPQSIISYISNDLLDSVLQDEQKTEVFDLIIDRIFVILNNQIMLPVYRDKKEFLPFISAISKKRNQQEAFHYFYSKVDDNMKIETTSNLVEFLKNLLHSGSSSRSVFDLYSTEVKDLCELCLSLLQAKQKLPKKYVKQILPIFFDHNPNILNVCKSIIQELLDRKESKDKESEKWPSLTKETFDIYFVQCFKLLNSKMSEIGKKLKNNKVEVLDETTIEMMLDRMIEISSSMSELLTSVSTTDIPFSTLQKVIQLGPIWMDSCTELLNFLKDAKQVYPDKVKFYIKKIRPIRRNLQAVVLHSRRNEPKLQKFLPRISKSLEVWTYNLRIVVPDIFESSEYMLTHMPEKTIENKDVNSQNE